MSSKSSLGVPIVAVHRGEEPKRSQYAQRTDDLEEYALNEGILLTRCSNGPPDSYKQGSENTDE